MNEVKRFILLNVDHRSAAFNCALSLKTIAGTDKILVEPILLPLRKKKKTIHQVTTIDYHLHVSERDD